MRVDAKQLCGGECVVRCTPAIIGIYHYYIIISTQNKVYIALKYLYIWVPTETSLNPYTYFYTHLGINLNPT